MGDSWSPTMMEKVMERMPPNLFLATRFKLNTTLIHAALYALRTMKWKKHLLFYPVSILFTRIV
eukprot:7617310-Ditylum_brightwellii.AAC.1